MHPPWLLDAPLPASDGGSPLQVNAEVPVSVRTAPGNAFYDFFIRRWTQIIQDERGLI